MAEPLRTCLGCRQRAGQDTLIRLVRVGQEVVEATSPRLPGRGAYLHPERSCLEQATRRRALQRAFGHGAQPAPALAERLDQIASGWNQAPSAG
ncbi:YlxR family protein [Tessaracoccus sp. OS52]|uniref:YlxR family protein n=1 Tax=Tessaracoccus sp. OS52 TaxID=2886691 RepID=UPI001D10DD19|nr:YlxR family protein [Tessaracoccus sp. OS52]